MNWIYTKYIQLLSPKLKLFKKVNNQYNFRCPLCGDSKKNPLKTRGWILTKNSKTFYHCFNCAATMPFKKFLQKMDQMLFDQMVLEEMREKGQHTQEFLEIQEFTQKLKVPEYVRDTALASLKKVSQLQTNHHAKVYIQDRLIPSEIHYKIFYAPKFKEWINTMIPNKFDLSKGRDEERIIFPLLDKNQKLVGIQGRIINSTSNDDVKYITIMLDEEHPKIFGLDTVDNNKTIIAMEGPIDSYFVSNSVASCGGRIEPIVEAAGLPKDKVIICYDNEPRSVDTVRKYSKAIENGYRVFIWPDNINAKDINNLVLDGMNRKYIRGMILENSVSGLEAKLKLAAWKKI